MKPLLRALVLSEFLLGVAAQSKAQTIVPGASASDSAFASTSNVTIPAGVTVAFTDDRACGLGEDDSAVYLLITSDALRPAFQALVNRRTAQGKTGKLVTTECIYACYDGTRPDGGSDNQTKIRNCIIDHYQNHGTQWVALGGDDNIIPIRYVLGTSKDDARPGELYYSDMDGGSWDEDADGIYGEAEDVTPVELYPDVYLGRISVRDTEQAAQYVQKVAVFEDTPSDQFPYGMLFITADTCPGNCYSGESRPPEFRHYDPVGNADHGYTNWYWDYIQPYWQAIPMHGFFASHTAWDEARWGDYQLSSAHLVDRISNGPYQFVVYSGHGNVPWWFLEDSVWGTGHAFQLANTVPFILRSGGCWTGAFDWYDTCICEAFLRREPYNPQGGAVVVTAYAGWPSGLHQDIMYEEMFEHNILNMGEAFTHAKQLTSASFDTYSQCIYVFLGDPAINRRSAQPDRHLQVYMPSGLEFYDPGDDIIIRWNASGTGFAADERVRLDCSANGGGTWAVIPGAEELLFNSMVFSWQDHHLPEGSTYRIRVVSLSDPSVVASSRLDFEVHELGLLTVQSAPFNGVALTGTQAGTTDYTHTVRLDDTVELTASATAESGLLQFARWTDGHGALLSGTPTLTFRFDNDQTVRAEYEHAGPIQHYYVNVEIGDDSADGTSPLTPVRTIQVLLDRYGDIGWGSIVNVSPGTYTENLVIGAAHSGLTLKGADADSTIVDGAMSGSCLRAENLRGLYVEGLTFRNGKAYLGGGISLLRTIAAEIRNCRIIENLAGTTPYNGWGGGIYVESGSAEVLDTILSGNRALYAGGGLYESSSRLAVSRCVFQSNRADWFGGGISCYDSDSRATIDASQFLGNSAGSWGGGVDVVFSSAMISSSLMIGNQAGAGGGLAGRGTPGEEVSQVSGCTFSGNVASEGGGVWAVDDSVLNIDNSVVWGNTATRGADFRVALLARVSVGYSDIPQTAPGFDADPTAAVTWEQGNLSADPLFVRNPSDGGDGWGDDPDTPDVDEGVNDDFGDLRLSPDSLCINAGDPDFVPQPGQTDLDGHARVLCDRVDMGGYEFGIGDYDCDDDVDLTDFAHWATCMTGPDNVPDDPYPIGCEAFDFEFDEDIDVADVAGFQRVFTRP